MAKKVLIVEDSAEIRGALKLLVEMEGYETSEASNGLEACIKAGKELPDLILMDLRLPGMDGDEATRQIHAQPETSSVPIVCVSSYAELYRDRLLKVGYIAVYTKTELVEDLSRILKKHLKTKENKNVPSKLKGAIT